MDRGIQCPDFWAEYRFDDARRLPRGVEGGVGGEGEEEDQKLVES